jgi:hypothetical protein
MTGRQLYRISGLVLVIGAIAFAVHVVLRSLITVGADPSSFAQQGPWAAINALGLVGAVLVLLGLPAMYARMAAATGRLGLAGTVLIAVAWMFFGWFLSLYALLLLPWLAAKAPELIATAAPLPTGFIVAFIAGLVAWLAGTVLLAIPFMRGHMQPRWAGYVLLASGLWMIVGNLIIAPSGPATNLAINLISNLGPVLLLVPICYLGYRMWVENARASQTKPATS